MVDRRTNGKADGEERRDETCSLNYTNASFLFAFEAVKFKVLTR